MSERPYHKYVFDIENRKFIGKFEEMYNHEEIESYDSWFQEDLRHLTYQISFVLLNRYNFSTVLKNELFSHLEVQNMLKIHAKILSLNIFLKIFFLT